MAAPILPERPVLVAPDAFRGSLRASQVAGAIGRGLERAGLMPPDLCPVSDGGEGTTECVLPALGGEIVAAPRAGASFALLEDGGLALVEVASGPSSRAAGELICAARDAGAAVILVAGGDGVAGSHAVEVIEDQGGLRGARLVVLRGTGAPGGLAEALVGRYGASAEPGAAWVLSVLDFDARMRAARAVVTGEDTLDFGTLEGRVVGEIGRRTRQAGVPLHAVVARARLDAFGRRMIDLQRVLEAGTLADLEAAGEQLGTELADGRA